MQNPWQTLSSTPIYTNPWIHLREDRIIDPSGNPGIYGVIEFQNRAVGVVPIDEHGNIWLVGQYRYCHQSYEWEIPKGGNPAHESLEDTARRELLEETGIKAEELLPLGHQIQLSNSTTNEVAYLFIARGLSFHQAKPESTEELQLLKLPLQDAILMAQRGEIRDAMSLLALFQLALQFQ